MSKSFKEFQPKVLVESAETKVVVMLFEFFNKNAAAFHRIAYKYKPILKGLSDHSISEALDDGLKIAKTGKDASGTMFWYKSRGLGSFKTTVESLEYSVNNNFGVYNDVLYKEALKSAKDALEKMQQAWMAGELTFYISEMLTALKRHTAKEDSPLHAECQKILDLVGFN